MTPQTLTTTQLANQLGFTPRTIQRWAREQRIPHLRIGRHVRFLPSQVQQIIDTYAAEPITPRPDATTPNHDYQPHIVVVPMRHPAPPAA
jgi:excisionase family DNA binding protein